MGDAYCTMGDVGNVMQNDFAGADPRPEDVEAAITGQVDDIRRKTRSHWYDSTAADNSTLANGTRSITNIQLDVPSSPHRQDRQYFDDRQGVRYPVTYSGPYARVLLPHFHVQSVTTLEVRDRDGGVTDWVADSSKTSGRGNDYYLHTEGDPAGRSYLYIDANEIGARTDYGDLLTVAYDYGHDGIPDSVRRANALLAAEELVIDDEFSQAIPNDGQLVNVQTKADKYHQRAMSLLETYLVSNPVA